MEIWVLGTLEVSHAGRAVEIRGPLPRRLLTLLTLTPGARDQRRPARRRALGRGTTASGGSHPAVARGAAAPGSARGRRRADGRRGYVLDVAAGDIDAFDLERPVALGSKALVDGRVRRGEQRCSPRRCGCGAGRRTPSSRTARRSRRRRSGCRALRLDALERRISADLGRPGVAPPVAELEALVHWHPMRESFWALLMARSTAPAARVRRWRPSSGPERPSPTSWASTRGRQLQELERLVLAQDPSLELSGMSTFLPSRAERGAYPDRCHSWREAPSSRP